MPPCTRAPLESVDEQKTAALFFSRIGCIASVTFEPLRKKKKGGGGFFWYLAADRRY